MTFRGKAFGLAAVLAFALGGAAAAAVFATSRTGHDAAPPPWRETAWPFPLDPWGRGRAYRCSAADCGAEVTVFIRTKSGFCNCTTGIADDNDLERVSDAELFGRDLPARAPGRTIRSAGLDGRSRIYLGATPWQGIIVAAFHLKCDAIVATALVAADRIDRAEPAVTALLDRRAVLRAALMAVR